MPVYKFRCKKCKNIEEIFCTFSKKKTEAEKLHCKNCGSDDFTEVYQLNLGSKDSGSSESSASCGTCSSGTCSTCY
ncbi:zinc ribbon domain-containing protein [Candidatus Woesearchaeota archaeon]|nr:zinc ribbon domain-containing protein [Candidatus Woesearchaeota archaeon]